MGEQAVGWAALPREVLSWMACGGTPALGCAMDPATMRQATLELARRATVGRTWPEPAPRMPNDPWTERAAETAARHQATIDKAFSPAKPERATPPADPWPMVCERIRNLSRAYSELVHELDVLRKARP